MKPFYSEELADVYHGDCIDVMRELPDGSVDAVVTDPPYGIRFMGESWDGADIVKRQERGKATSPMPEGVGGPNGGYRSLAAEAGRYNRSMKASLAFMDWCREWAFECYRLLKPGGHLLAFGSPRCYHQLGMGIELAGFEVRDTIAWLFGQGFPKSLDVGKAIDKRLGATREKVGERIVPDATKSRLMFAGMTSDGEGTPTRTIDVTADATPEARAWHGWGTALKPAFEPCVVARKPITGSVADNVLANGVGALNIDASRIHTEGSEGCEYKVKRFKSGSELAKTKGNWRPDDGEEYVGKTADGRWPTNVALDVAAADELDSQTGGLSDAKPHALRRRGIGYGSSSTGGDVELGYEDSGGASRFFPAFRYEAKASSAERPKVDGVQHPTVKPLDLMRWLVRLVAPQGATILEPFAGSGTTIEACIAEGMRCIAIEREEQYLPLILDRISKPIDVPLPIGI
jgi:site-specific DNA-methyltransferase (adenine-specific)